MGLFSCSNESLDLEDEKNALPDAQAFVTNASVTQNAFPTTRSEDSLEVTSFHFSFNESFSGQIYDFNFIVNEDGTFGIDYDGDNVGEIQLSVEGEQIKSIFNDDEFLARVTESEENGILFYSIENMDPATRAHRRISWYDCVKRIAFNEDAAVVLTVASCFYSPIYCAAVAAAGAICLLDEDMRVVNE